VRQAKDEFRRMKDEKEDAITLFSSFIFCLHPFLSLRREGFEPPTSALSGQRSAAELTARIVLLSFARLGSNQQPPLCESGALTS
jgi:hypothetical protein